MSHLFNKSHIFILDTLDRRGIDPEYPQRIIIDCSKYYFFVI